MSDLQLTEDSLKQFTGSETFTRHGLNRDMVYTEGVAYVMEVGHAYWLVDDIAIFNMCNGFVRREPFQVWKLTKNANGCGAKLVCEDGNKNKVFQENIKFTDFPLQTITLWVENSTIMLPSER